MTLDKKPKIHEHEIDKNKMEVVLLSKLPTDSILSGHVFYLSKNQKKYFLLARAGSTINFEFIERYQSRGVQELLYYPIANLTIQKKIHDEMERLRSSELEVDRLRSRESFLKMYHEFTQKNSNMSQFDFYQSFYQIFCKIPRERQRGLYEQSEIMFQRSYRLAAVAALLALIKGYTDFEVLSDIYHLAFLLDISLFNNLFDYHLVQACERERLQISSGLKYLKNQSLSSNLQFLFSHHPRLSVQIIREEFKNIIFEESLIDIVKYHHSPRTNGEYSSFGLSDVELLLVFCDSIVSYDAVMYIHGDSHQFLEKIIKQRMELGHFLNDLPIDRILHRLKNISIPEAEVS